MSKPMDLKALRNYNEWLKTSPSEVLKAVRNVHGGWATVFPDQLPLWAHRVRNFFNREPKSLLRLGEVQSKAHIGRIETKYPPDKIAEKYALSDDVYRDAQNWHWYQMNEGGTIYHWGSKPKVPKFEGPYQEVKEKLGIPAPVFKLVAPDGTGGSRETILRNIHRVFVAVKKENFLAYVAHMTINDPHDRGSYNYSETVKAGYDAHKMRDVDPHEKYDFPNVYINPPALYPFSSPSERQFPEKDNLGRPLASQVNRV
jgi:hypothetical protein